MTASLPNRLERVRTGWVVLAFVLGGIGWFIVHPVDASVSMDDGAYAITVDRLQQGTWTFPYGASEADPGGAAFPYPNGERGEDGYYPYIRQPAWIVALRAADDLAGPWGMRGLVLFLAAGAVAATAGLARAAGLPRLAPLAAALAALSPLAFNALQLWAHAPAALCVAVAAIAGCLALDARPPAWAWPTAVLAALTAALLRGDGALFVFAVGLVIFGAGARARRWNVSVLGVGTAAAAVAGQVLTGTWAGWINGGEGAGRATDARGTGGSSDRIGAALQTLVAHDASAPVAYLLVILALLLVAAAVYLARRGDPRAARALLVLAASVWLIRVLVERDELATGLLGAWPAALLVFLTPWAERTVAERRLLVMVALGTGAVLATQYDAGGGANWGGRFLAPALPLIAVLVAASVHRWSTSTDGRTLRVWLPVAALAVITTVASLGLDSHYRLRNDRQVAALEELAPDQWVVTSSFALPNLAWRTVDDVRWLLVPTPEAGGVDRMAEILEDLGVEEFVALNLRDDDFSTLTGLPADRNEPAVPSVVDLDG